MLQTNDLTGWCCFVINLERSTHRLQRVQGELERAGLPFQRFAAVDGREIDPDRTPDFHRRAYELRHGKTPTCGEIGCFFSHIGVMRAFLETDASYCLILEDDVCVDPNIRRILNGLSRLSDGWDVAMLYGNHRGMPKILGDIDRSHNLVGFFSRQTGAVAYAVNRKAAAVYIEQLLPMTLPIDIDFDRAWDFGIKFRGVIPFPVATGAYPSDIGVTGTKFPWYKRLPTYVLRIMNEARRIIHYAIADPIWLLAMQYWLVHQVRSLPRRPSAPAMEVEIKIVGFPFS